MAYALPKEEGWEYRGTEVEPVSEFNDEGLSARLSNRLEISYGIKCNIGVGGNKKAKGERLLIFPINIRN